MAIFNPERKLLLVNSQEIAEDKNYLTPLVPKADFPFWQAVAKAKEPIVEDYIFWSDLAGNKRVTQQGDIERALESMQEVFDWAKKRHVGRAGQGLTYRIHVPDGMAAEAKESFLVQFEKAASGILRVPFTVDDKNPEVFTAGTNLENDQASAEDFLGFRSLARSLGAFVKHRATGLPLSIAIDGPWGTGKSSLMLMLQDDLDGGAARDTAASRPSLWSEARQATLLFYYTLEPFFVVLGVALIGLSFSVWQGFLSLGLPESNQTRVPGFMFLGAITYLGLSTTAWWRRRAGNQMRLAKGAPRAFDTVFINAWRHGHGTRLKAAIMKRIINQLIAKRGVRFFLKLQLARFNRMSYMGTVFRAGIMNGIFLITLFMVGIVLLFSEGNVRVAVWFLGDVDMPRDFIGGLVAVISIALKFGKRADVAKMKDFLTSPDYEKLAGPDDEIEEDFERILDLLKEEGRALAIFIDDLDRCSPETVHQVVEALNVFFGKQNSECLFILGMHKELVAVSLEVAYKDMAEKLEGNPLLKAQLPYGRRFLEKIVQFVVPVPTPRKHDIELYVKQLTIGTVANNTAALAETKFKLDQLEIPGFVAEIDLWFSKKLHNFKAWRIGDFGKDAAETSTEVEEKISSLPSDQQEEFKKAIAALEQEEERLKEAAAFKPTDTDVLDIFAEIRPALRSNPRQYKRFFNHFRFNRFVSEALGDLPLETAKRNDAIIAAIALEYPLLYRWAFENLEVGLQERRIEAALVKVKSHCVCSKGGVEEKLPENAGDELRILHTYQYDFALKSLIDAIDPDTELTAQAAE